MIAVTTIRGLTTDELRKYIARQERQISDSDPTKVEMLAMLRLILRMREGGRGAALTSA